MVATGVGVLVDNGDVDEVFASRGFDVGIGAAAGLVGVEACRGDLDVEVKKG